MKTNYLTEPGYLFEETKFIALFLFPRNCATGAVRAGEMNINRLGKASFVGAPMKGDLQEGGPRRGIS